MKKLGLAGLFLGICLMGNKGYSDTSIMCQDNCNSSSTLDAITVVGQRNTAFDFATADWSVTAINISMDSEGYVEGLVGTSEGIFSFRNHNYSYLTPQGLVLEYGKQAIKEVSCVGRCK